MGLQNQAFENCKKWMPSYKERQSSLDKCLSTYCNVIYQRLVKHPMKSPHLFIESGSKCKTSFDLLVFHHDF